MPFKRATAIVAGIEAANALASKLIMESAFFEMTPLPDGEYQFSVKEDRKELLTETDANWPEFSYEGQRWSYWEDELALMDEADGCFHFYAYHGLKNPDPETMKVVIRALKKSGLRP